MVEVTAPGLDSSREVKGRGNLLVSDLRRKSQVLEQCGYSAWGVAKAKGGEGEIEERSLDAVRVPDFPREPCALLGQLNATTVVALLHLQLGQICGRKREAPRIGHLLSQYSRLLIQLPCALPISRDRRNDAKLSIGKRRKPLVQVVISERTGRPN